MCTRGKDYYSYIYFSSIAVDKKHRNVSTLLKLISAFKLHIKSLLDEGIEIKEVMADCLTKEGKKATRNFLKLNPVATTEHGSKIYTLDGKTFVEQVLGRESEKEN